MYRNPIKTQPRGRHRLRYGLVFEHAFAMKCYEKFNFIISDHIVITNKTYEKAINYDLRHTVTKVGHYSNHKQQILKKPDVTKV